MKVYAGVEGGATHSRIALFNEQAEILAEVKGPGTNLFQIGLAETCSRIANMYKEALSKASLDQSTKLASLGLSLSGCEVEETNKLLALKMVEMYPDIVSREPKVCSDTVGSLMSASDKGGVVLIAGTGSNSLLVNPDGSIARCGGWGHILGDEGGAFWIAQKAIKTWFDDEDNLVKAPYPTEVVVEQIQNYFGITDRFGLLTFCYDQFKKQHFAGLAKYLSHAADQGDQLSQWIFAEAGKVLAKHIVALSSSMSNELKMSLSVVCIGSVWKSWEHLKPGFEMEMETSEVLSYELLKLKVPMATGACYLAADETFQKKYHENTERFFSN